MDPTCLLRGTLAHGLAAGPPHIPQVHAVASQGDLRIELPHLGGSSTPLGLSPKSLERLEAVRSPTQQLLSRENSGSADAAVQGGGAFERALREAAGSQPGGSSGAVGPPAQSVILLDSLSSSSKRPLQRR